MDNNFILGSASPRRRALLGLTNLKFQVQVSDGDEDSITAVDPLENVRQRAELKANSFTAAPSQPTILITADTTVAIGRQMLNKPANAAEARYMLNQLRNTVHQVHTAITLRELSTNRLMSVVDTADVTMRDYTDDEIEAYIASGDPFDKAGAYAIQHSGFKPVAKLNGCYLSVMGLSLCVLRTMLQQWSVSVTIDRVQLEQAHTPFPCPHLA